MIKTLIKHFIYEKALTTLFCNVSANFVSDRLRLGSLCKKVEIKTHLLLPNVREWVSVTVTLTDAFLVNIIQGDHFIFQSDKAYLDFETDQECGWYYDYMCENKDVMIVVVQTHIMLYGTLYWNEFESSIKIS